jgi:hypothetical protein
MKIFFLVFCLAVPAFAQSGGQFSITRNVVAGGGAVAAGSSRFTLSSTVGQPLAATPASARFSIQGGFWVVPPPVLFAPVKAGTNFLVSIQSEAGKNYSLEFQNTLGGNWQNLANVSGNGSILTVTNHPPAGPQGFIRLLEH